MDESAKLPKVPASVTFLTINLGQVTRLNSNGTRLWAIWAKSLPPKLPIKLEECPVIFIKSFTLIKGILSSNMEVQSFFVPFYSERTGERTSLLVERNQHFFDDGRIELPLVKDSRGDSMDVDAIPASYFAFLKR